MAVIKTILTLQSIIFLNIQLAELHQSFCSNFTFSFILIFHKFLIPSLIIIFQIKTSKSITLPNNNWSLSTFIQCNNWIFLINENKIWPNLYLLKRVILKAKWCFQIAYYHTVNCEIVLERGKKLWLWMRIFKYCETVKWDWKYCETVNWNSLSPPRNKTVVITGL